MAAQIFVQIVGEPVRKVREELLTRLFVLRAEISYEDLSYGKAKIKQFGPHLFLERPRKSIWGGYERRYLAEVEDCVLGSESEIILRVYGDDKFLNSIKKIVEQFAGQKGIAKVTLIQDDEEPWRLS